MPEEMNDKLDPRLEAAAEAIRNETPDAATVEAAAARVWANLQAAAVPGEPGSACAGFRALFPQYLAKELPAARALLLEDHLHECVGCRKALDAARGKVVAMPLPAAKRPFTQHKAVRWAMAAALAVTVGAGAWFTVEKLMSGGPRATVASLEGGMYRASGGALAAGAEIGENEEIRTLPASHAVLKLADGSQVELGERAALRVSRSGRDTTVHLGRGRIIVEAAKRHSGHLYVATADARVSVTGTIFSVNSGLKGSRVSVVEGEVRVARQGREDVLHPGQQVATSEAMGRTAVADEIAWSQNVNAYLALMRDLTAVQRQFDQLSMPGLRHESKLLALVPADTKIYAALPNIGEALAEANKLLHERTENNPALQAWWKHQLKNGEALDQVIERLRAVSGYLGEEIVLASNTRGPVFLAEVKKPGLREALPAELVQAGVVTIVNNVAAIGPKNSLAEFEATLRAGGSGFAGTPFHERIAQEYREGAGFLFCADLGEFSKGKGPADLQYVVAGQRRIGQQTQTRAVFSFPSNTGLPSWLAAPGPMGALEFFSPDANIAAAFVVSDPAGRLAEFLAAASPGAKTEVEQAQTELGIDIQRDLAGALGGEVAVGFDGFAGPLPGIKVVLEVTDPSRLQYAFGKVAERVRQEHAELSLTTETVQGRDYWVLKVPAAQLLAEFHYTYADGYLVGSNGRNIVQQALQQKSTGYSLPRSDKFQELLPRDRYANFSGVVYQNMGAILGVAADFLGGAVKLDGEGKKALAGLTADMKPALIGVYAEGNRVTVSTSASVLGFSLNQLLALNGPMGLTNLFGTRGGKPAYKESNGR